MEQNFIQAIDVYERKEYYKNNLCKKSDKSGIYFKNIITKLLEQLAIYYDDYEINKEKAVKYYKMAIDKGSTNSIYNLAHHYFEQNDFENKG
jgi:TPR repeat protein